MRSILNSNLIFKILVLNREDPEWFWIVRSDGQEGFIPSGFVYPADNVLQGNAKSSTLATSPVAPLAPTFNNVSIPANVNSPQQHNNVTTGVGNGNLASNSMLGGSDDLRYHGTELVMLYDYKVSKKHVFISN